MFIFFEKKYFSILNVFFFIELNIKLKEVFLFYNYLLKRSKSFRNEMKQ
jgi:hypothetical protein